MVKKEPTWGELTKTEQERTAKGLGRILKAIEKHAVANKKARRELAEVQWDEAIDRLVEIVLLHQPGDSGYCEGCDVYPDAASSPNWPCVNYRIAMGLPQEYEDEQ